MVEIITAPDVEAVAISYLKSHLTDGTKVATKAPTPVIGRFVRVQSAPGGNDSLVLSERLLIVQCWDPQAPAASALAEWCFAILKAAQRDPAEPRIRAVTVAGTPASFPDPDTTLPRYQFTVGLTLRGRLR